MQTASLQRNSPQTSTCRDSLTRSNESKNLSEHDGLSEGGNSEISIEKTTLKPSLSLSLSFFLPSSWRRRELAQLSNRQNLSIVLLDRVLPLLLGVFSTDEPTPR